MGFGGRRPACGRPGCAKSPAGRAANSRRSAKVRAHQTTAEDGRAGIPTGARCRCEVQATARGEATRSRRSTARVEGQWLELTRRRVNPAAQASAVADLFSRGWLFRYLVLPA